MSVWDRHFHTPVPAARLFLMVRGTLVLLALDIVALMVPYGSRYGVKGYNLAHFELLDHLGVPSPARFLATLFLAAMVAMTAAMATPNSLSVGLVAGLFSYAWSMSMITAWRHYYLLSLVLVCFALVPRVRPNEILARVSVPPDPPAEPVATAAPKGRGKKKPAATVSVPPPEVRLSVNALPAWGFRLATTNLALVYFFMAVSKFEHAWRSGLVLQMIDQQNGSLSWLRSLAASVGVSAEAFFHVMGVVTIGLQLCIAAAYLLAPHVDASRGRALRWFCGLALVGAVVFHLGADAIGLKIGWFSRYMLVMAVASLTPTPWLVALARMVSDPLDSLCRAWAAVDHTKVRPTLALGLGASAALAITAAAMDLPGAPWAFGLCAVGALVATGLGASRGHGEAVRRYAIASIASVAVVWATIVAFDVRYDYYRFLGADEQRVGELERALSAYKKAEQYAPSGESRRDRIEALEAEIEARRNAAGH